MYKNQGCGTRHSMIRPVCRPCSSESRLRPVCRDLRKGFQGAVKRFGVKLTSHKSEKTRRHAGNLGAWTPSRVGHTVPLAGQHGCHERTEWNKWIFKVSANPEEVNPAEGFRSYGIVKNDFLLVKGSIQGPKKRMVTLVRSIRPNGRYPKVAPQITYINK